MIEVTTLPLGDGQTNCYILFQKDTKHALIIDPGAEPQKIYRTIENLGAIPLAILLTHTHYDHIGAVDTIRDAYDIPVYVDSKEQDWLTDGSKNLSSMLGQNITARPAEYLFNPGETLEISGFSFKIIPTPGHSPGGVSFIFPKEKFVVTGDALFAGSVGRMDLPGGNSGQLFNSIRQQLFTLPEDYIIYPGHGGSSTIGREMTTNPFFN